MCVTESTFNPHTLTQPREMVRSQVHPWVLPRHSSEECSVELHATNEPREKFTSSKTRGSGGEMQQNNDDALLVHAPSQEVALEFARASQLADTLRSRRNEVQADASRRTAQWASESDARAAREREDAKQLRIGRMTNAMRREAAARQAREFQHELAK